MILLVLFAVSIVPCQLMKSQKIQEKGKKWKTTTASLTLLKFPEFLSTMLEEGTVKERTHRQERVLPPQLPNFRRWRLHWITITHYQSLLAMVQMVPELSKRTENQFKGPFWKWQLNFVVPTPFTLGAIQPMPISQSPLLLPSPGRKVLTLAKGSQGWSWRPLDGG